MAREDQATTGNGVTFFFFWADIDHCDFIRHGKLQIAGSKVVNDKAISHLVSEGFTAPRGTPTAYAVMTPTARFPFI
ncbi:hypothetical protein DVP10_14505 [Yersinia enterocolitica]|nr:hypothetical protein [Yersinia enterocolitica]EKN5145813.1 hypothetical protein [Yersinia enterocolitica]EKN6092780.1 hypothetical protein [Yersinia enterocolitica]